MATVGNGHLIASVSGLAGLNSSSTNTINMIGFDTSHIEATIENNTITGSGGSGIRAIQEGNGTITARIAGNTVEGTVQDNGILAQARAGTGGAGSMNLTMSNNTVNIGGALSLDGIEVTSGSSAGGDTNTICLNMFSNNSTSANYEGYYLRQRTGSTFQLQDFASGTAANWVTNTKSNVGSVFTSGSFVNAPAPCPTPTVPSAAPVTGATGREEAKNEPQAGVVEPAGARTSLAVPAGSPVAQAGVTDRDPSSGETVNVNLGTLDAGQVVRITFDVTVDDPPVPVGTAQVCNQGIFSGANFISVATDDPAVGGAADPTCTSLDVIVDLVLAKDDGIVAVAPGDTILYTLAYTNTGSTTATGVTLAEVVPAHTAFNASASSSGWSCADGAPAGSNCSLTVADLAGNGGADSVAFAVDVANPLASNVSGISNSATISSSGTDATPANNTATESTPIGAGHFFVAPDSTTCAANVPCLFGAGAIQDGLNRLNDSGEITVLGSHTLAGALSSGNGGANNATVAGSSGALVSAITSANNAAGFAVGSGNLTVKGLNLIAGSTADPLFDHGGSGSLHVYANNIGGWTGDPHQGSGGSADLGNNYWGVDAYDATDPGLPGDGWQRRLGAAIAQWSGGSDSATLGGASLGGGTGIAVIISHGRGSAAAPFDSGVAPYVDETCSDFYDFFVREATGLWTVRVPVDPTAACSSDPGNPLTNDRLYTIPDIGDCAPGSAGCWNLAPNLSHSGSQLISSGLSPAALSGTPFVAGTPEGLDPTAVQLSVTTAGADGFPFWLPLLLALVTLLGLMLRRRTLRL
jgi:uncharacterized repeat protein (TIGR01451 family)